LRLRTFSAPPVSRHRAQIVPSGSSGQGGLQGGDVIVSVNGEAVNAGHSASAPSAGHLRQLPEHLTPGGEGKLLMDVHEDRSPRRAIICLVVPAALALMAVLVPARVAAQGTPQQRAAWARGAISVHHYPRDSPDTWDRRPREPCPDRIRWRQRRLTRHTRAHTTSTGVCSFFVL
jgi:hypothetical protein